MSERKNRVYIYDTLRGIVSTHVEASTSGYSELNRFGNIINGNHVHLSSEGALGPVYAVQMRFLTNRGRYVWPGSPCLGLCAVSE